MGSIWRRDGMNLPTEQGQCRHGQRAISHVPAKIVKRMNHVVLYRVMQTWTEGMHLLLQSFWVNHVVMRKLHSICRCLVSCYNIQNSCPTTFVLVTFDTFWFVSSWTHIPLHCWSFSCPKTFNSEFLVKFVSSWELISHYTADLFLSIFMNLSFSKYF